jgi:hypothetical protein
MGYFNVSTPVTILLESPKTCALADKKPIMIMAQSIVTRITFMEN